MSQNLQDLIQILQSNNFKAECPNCNGKMDLSEADLFDAEFFKFEGTSLINAKYDFRKEPKLVLNNRELQILKTTNKNVKFGFNRTEDNFFKAQPWGRF